MTVYGGGPGAGGSGINASASATLGRPVAMASVRVAISAYLAATLARPAASSIVVTQTSNVRVLNVGFPTGPLLDPTTNDISPIWRQFMLSLWTRTGGPTGKVTT